MKIRKDKTPDFIIKRRKFQEKFPLVTLKAIYDAANQDHPEKIGFREIIDRKIVSYSYKQFTNDINALGTCLMNMGLEGCHMAVLGENSYGWLLAYLTTALMGTIVTLDKELTPADMKVLTSKADCDYLFVSTNYLDRAREIKVQNAGIKGIFVWGNIEEAELRKDEWSYQELIKKGEGLLEEGETMYLSREIKPDDVAAIVFTSGTTGLNKGVMLTHKNICANIKGVAEGFSPIIEPCMSVLPMTHAYEMNCADLVAIYFGHELCINGSLKNLLKDMQKMKPAMMLVVPMFLEKFYDSIWSNARKTGRETDLRRALRVSKVSRALGIDVRERLFKDIFEIFGGNLRFFVCGGAALNGDIAKGMEDFGFIVQQGYGITECAPLVAFNKEKKASFSSVGPAIPGIKIKISHPDALGVGEVLVKSDSCTIGYYNDPESTEKVFTDGWYHTGDYGYLDIKGRLWLYGRKKNLIILDNGKNVYPEEIEMEIAKSLPFIEDVVVFEEKMKVKDQERLYITAAISIPEDSETAAMPLSERNIMIRDELRKVNANLATYKSVGMFYTTTEPFKKNAAKKIMRRAINKNKDEYVKI